MPPLLVTGYSRHPALPACLLFKCALARPSVASLSDACTACVRMLAIQNPVVAVPGVLRCDKDCCKAGMVADAAFDLAYANHNYNSDIGPDAELGPWVIAELTNFDRFSFNGFDNQQLNFGPGLEDIYPCPLHPTQRDFNNRLNYGVIRDDVRETAAQRQEAVNQWTLGQNTCDPASCKANDGGASNLIAGGSGPYGCDFCDTAARVACAHRLWPHRTRSERAHRVARGGECTRACKGAGERGGGRLQESDLCYARPVTFVTVTKC